MSFEQLIQLVPTYVLVFFRVAGMMVFAPLLGSSRIPRRVKVLLCAIIAMGMAGSVPPLAALPEQTWQLVLAIGGELVFGVAMGMVLSLVFIAAQWAGEVIGQQIGLNLSQVFDPQFGAQGSIVGELYFMLTLVIFLVVGGHRAMIAAVRDSFDALPLLSVGMNAQLLDLLVGLMLGAMSLAIQLAAPVMVTILVVDLAMGFISKTLPQMNVLTAGLSLRGVVGMVVLIAGIGMTSEVVRESVLDSMHEASVGWTTAAESPT